MGRPLPSLPSDHHLSASSAIMSLRTNFDADLAESVRLTVAITLGRRVFLAVIDGRDFVVRQVSSPDGVAGADLTIETEPRVLAGLLYGGLTATQAVADGILTVSGPRADLKRFLGVFHLPPKAALPSAS